MRRRSHCLAILAAVAFFGVRSPAQMRVEVALPAGGAVFGRRFELSVQRAWPRDHDPQPFDEAMLAPLEVRELGVSMSASGTELIELRRFDAVAFEVGEVAFLPYVVRTRGPDGREHATEVAAAPLTVRSSLPDPPGEVEWPGDVRGLPASPIWPWLTAAVLAVAGGVWLLQPRRRRTVAAGLPAEPRAAELARAEIEALALPGADRDRLGSYYLELAEIVRRFAARQFGVRAVVHTSEELIAVVPLGGDPLRQCLFLCDLVKFAADRPAQSADREAKARALAFVASAEPEPEPEPEPRGRVGGEVV